MAGDRIFYTSINGKQFGTIYLSGHTESISLNCNPSNFVISSKETEAYVVCSGGEDSEGLLLKLSLFTKQVLHSLVLEKGFDAFSLALTSDDKTLYVVNINSLFLYALMELLWESSGRSPFLLEEDGGVYYPPMTKGCTFFILWIG